MRRLHLLVATTFAVTTLFAVGCSQPVDEEAGSAEGASSGSSVAPSVAEYGFSTDMRDADLEITASTATSFAFTLSVQNKYGGYNSGYVTGNASGKDGAFTYTAEGCKLSFELTGSSVAIAQEGICDMGAGVLADGTYAKKPRVPSHCAEGERIVFTCQSASKKLISLCAKDGGIQYRFGAAGRPELTLPETMAPIASKPDVAEGGFISLAGAGAGGAYATFHKGEYDYSVFTMEMSKGLDSEGLSLGTQNQSGVLVTKGGKRVTFVACAAAPKSSLPSDLVAESKGEFDLLELP